MISTKALKVVYRPINVEALSDVTLEIPLQTTTCIVGPNASGKTTLLRALAGLVEYEGAVFIDGKEARELGKELRKILAYTAPFTTSDLLGVRVLDVLLTSRYPVSPGLVDREEDVSVIYKVAEALGVHRLLERRVNELSSGEAQRVLIAAALVREPRILLLDEPDSHLDVSTKPRLSQLLKELSEKCTVILSTHDPLFAFYTCKYFIVLSRGKVLYVGYLDDILENLAPLEKAFGVKFAKVNFNGVEVPVPLYSAHSAEPSEGD